MASCFRAVKDKRPVKLFFEDEARFGRINNVSRCWVPPGSRAVVGQQMVREYIYAYTAICPQTGENYSIIAPVTNTQVMNVFLKALSKRYRKYRIVLCLDAAGWHISGALKVPENIELLLLPAYSPQLNPTEHLWDYIREQKGFNNHVFTSIDEVEQQLEKALKEINDEKQVIKGMCYFNWLKRIS